MKKKKHRWIVRMLYFLIVYFLWGCSLYTFQESLIFPKDVIPKLEKPKVDGREVWVTTKQGHLVEGWFLPALVEEQEITPKPTIMLFHGNAEIIDFWAKDMRTYRKWGFNVFLGEYRGYGRSQGNPSQKGITEDMIQFREWLLKQPEVDKEQFVYYGRSLGGGVACQLAKHHPPKAMILQSTFTSVARIAKRFLVPGFLLKHPFYNDKVVKELDIPIFIIHGLEDEIIPFAHAQDLDKLAKKSTFYQVNSGHNDVPMNQEYWRRVFKFLQDSEIKFSGKSSD